MPGSGCRNGAGTGLAVGVAVAALVLGEEGALLWVFDAVGRGALLEQPVTHSRTAASAAVDVRREGDESTGRR
jgi:hypothetical protein